MEGEEEETDIMSTDTTAVMGVAFLVIFFIIMVIIWGYSEVSESNNETERLRIRAESCPCLDAGVEP